MHVLVRIIPNDVPSVVRWPEDIRRYVPYREGDKGTPLELFVAR